MVSRYTAMCDFRKQTPIAVAPGYVLEGAGLQMLPDAKWSRTP
jgi:hypothetical protein